MEQKFLDGRKKAMALLNYRDRTQWELCDKMEQKGFSQEVIEDAVAYVKSFHYIDDLRYAVRYADIYKESRSIQRIRQDLKKKHIPEQYIEQAIEEIESDDSVALKKQLEKMCRGKTDFSYEEKQKIAQKLYRKGFRTEDIFRELDKI